LYPLFFAYFYTMKALPFQIPKPVSDAIVYQEDTEYVFYDKYHQHEEIQISYIAQGEGTLVVADTINYFNTGDVFVIGSHIPHVFKSVPKSDEKSIMLSIFFTQESFGASFFELEEMKSIKPFFRRAGTGFTVNSNKFRIKELFLKLQSSTKFYRFLILMELLPILSKSKIKALSSFVNKKTYSDQDGRRMRAIMEYTMNNFRNKITLENVAQRAAMTKNAFCKYFKKRTNKTYFQFLNEIRIETASKHLLQDNELSVVEVAELCGFINMSNFNRQFKSIKHMNPSQFKKIK